MTGFNPPDAPPLPGDGPLLPEPLPPDPFGLFLAWFDEAVRGRIGPNPNAFTLATVDPDGRPSARVLLCKAVDPARGSISFFTNYASRKSEALVANPYAAAVFFWDSLARQVRLEGPVVRIPEAESDAYFSSRPWQSRVGAWASDQSRPIRSRAAMLARVRDTMVRFGIDPDRPASDADQAAIARPPHWGGWVLIAARVELWLSSVGRVHDRAAWTRQVATTGQGPITGTWSSTRIQP
jgi:pyridoxamine 5'-phosphate oxidase